MFFKQKKNSQIKYAKEVFKTYEVEWLINHKIVSKIYNEFTEVSFQWKRKFFEIIMFYINDDHEMMTNLTSFDMFW